MPTIGQILRDARERKQVSTSKAAVDTNIKIQHIEAMERDDFSRMAAPVYAKGFIRLYADYLGVDPGPLIAEYMEKHAPRERAPLLASEYEQQQRQQAAAPGAAVAGRINWPALREKGVRMVARAAPAVGVAVVVALIGWGGWRALRRARERGDAGTAAEVRAEKPEPKRAEWPLIAEPPEPYMETGQPPAREKSP